MSYCLTTGTTGLLGEYLLRDLLLAGQDLAVLVRPSKAQPARARIEAILRRWEQLAGRFLPRPVVLEGNLAEPNLGLADSQLDWIRAHCDRMLHNAASLTFTGGKDREPWITNLLGTQRVLDVCERTGIRQFHHVSTAYVCGTRRGRILENELDVGQTFGNDYEESKFESESLIRKSSFLDRVTVYRPAIIVGDSLTGYTSTYHGFYLPLKLVYTMLKQLQHEIILPERLLDSIDIDGPECKNLVPVDWVSAVISFIFTNSQLHGQTYHVTPSERVPSKTIGEVMDRTLQEHVSQARELPGTTKALDLSQFEAFFAENMKVYQAYWGDDPIFDTSNLTAAAPHLACPRLNDVALARLCKYAIQNNFGSKIGLRNDAEAATTIEDEVIGHIPSTNSPVAQVSERNQKAATQVGFRISGPGGGQWTVRLDSKNIAWRSGIGSDCDITFYANSGTIHELLNRRLSPHDGLTCGEVSYEGVPRPLSDATQILQHILAI